jgi:hypothetical protein
MAIAATLTIGSWFGRERLTKIQIGSVWMAPAVNVVTMISSKDRAKARRPPASSAVRSCGKTRSGRSARCPPRDPSKLPL